MADLSMSREWLEFRKDFVTMKNILLAVVVGWSLAVVVPARAITFGPFGPHGEGGSKNGQTMTIGSGGTVFELDGFLSVNGADLNGSQFGTSAQLSRDTLPAGMGYSFTNYLSSDQADLVLSYTFTNTSSGVFSNLYFFVLLDPEIDEQTNTFFNEYGGTNGAPGLHGYDPSQWQIDEPGFLNGTLLKNIFVGSLNGSNSIPLGASNDVAMSLGFTLGNLNPGAGSTVLVQISQQGDALGSFSLAQHDSDPASTTVITLSGVIPSLIVLKGQVVSDGNTTATNAPANPSNIGLSNVVVTLSSNSIPVMTNVTDTAGQYLFSVPPGIQPGTYAVSANAPGLTFVSVPPAVKAYFAASNPSTNALPKLVPVLNFDFRGAVTPPPPPPGTNEMNVSGLVNFGLTAWKLNYAAGSLLGTLNITNPASSTVAFGPPWQLGLKSSPNFFYRYPNATNLPDGVTNIDVSVAMRAQLPNGVLNPGQSVALTNAVEIYSRYRSAPTNTLFEIWASQK